MLVIQADLVTFDDTHRVLERGRILIDDDGRISQVQAAKEALPDAFAQARTIDYPGYVYPGLVDLHNHIPYNTIGLWGLPDRPQPFVDHNQWTRPVAYSRQITAPQKFLGWAAGAALLSYVETKAILAGTTTLQGNGRAHPRDGVLTRNLDTERFGATADRFRVDTLVKAKAEEFDSVRDAMVHKGAGYIYHLAEGLPGTAMSKEWKLAQDGGVILDHFVGIHGTGLRKAQLQELAENNSSLVWSPFSNLWLYGGTADIVTAKALGIRLCLGSDWAPSGTRNVLGELKVAKLWNNDPAAWYPPQSPGPPVPAGGVFTDQELCDLVTRNPGDTISEVYERPQIGRIQSGYLADLILVRRGEGDPYANLVQATEPDVELVLVGGEARCGTRALITASGVKKTQAVHYSSGGGTHERRVLLRDPARPDRVPTWKSVTGRLEAVRADPQQADQELASALASAAAGQSEPVFILEGDMPPGPGLSDSDTVQGAGAGPAVKPDPVPIPPIDPLTHDKAFFDVIDAHPYHRGLLSSLRGFYPGT